MNVRMNFEFLAPGMQHAEEANLCAEVSRIARHFEKGFPHWYGTEDRRGPSCSEAPVGPTDGAG